MKRELVGCVFEHVGFLVFGYLCVCILRCVESRRLHCNRES